MGIEVEHRMFADVDEHAQALSQWEQRYQQVSAGHLRSSLTQLTEDDLSIFRETFSQRVTQRGVSPNGPVVTFGTVIATGPSPSAWFQGQPLGAYDFLCIPGQTEFTLHLPANATVFGITLQQNEWENLLPEEIHVTFRQLLQRQRLSLSPREYFSLCRLITRVLGQSAPATLRSAQSDDLERIPAFIASAVTGGAIENRRNLTHRVHADIVERCCRIAMQPAETPVTVADLCAEIKISPRTLSNSFVAVTGTSPASYLRSVRLAEVRKFLSATTPASVSIGEAAARWGFSSIHFASLYQRHYGELPSATRRKHGAKTVMPPPLMLHT